MRKQHKVVVVVVEVFFLGGCVEKWVVLRCMDRYAEAGTVEEGEGF